MKNENNFSADLLTAPLPSLMLWVMMSECLWSSFWKCPTRSWTAQCISDGMLDNAFFNSLVGYKISYVASPAVHSFILDIGIKKKGCGSDTVDFCIFHWRTDDALRRTGGKTPVWSAWTWGGTSTGRCGWQRWMQWARSAALVSFVTVLCSSNKLRPCCSGFSDPLTTAEELVWNTQCVNDG